MAEPVEFWTFLASNLVVLGFGGVLTWLSLLAYRRNPETRAFGVASFGFGAITVGSLVEAVYELGVRGSYELGGRELLALHSIEGLLIAVGLASLFYSIRQY